VLNKRLTSHPITIKIPNGATIQSTHVAELDLPMLRPDARKAHIVPALDDCSLLSLGQLCDAGYQILLEANTLSVLDDGHTILTGSREHSTGMWQITLPSPTHQSHHLGKQSTSDMVAFAHATLFSPSLSTLEKALTNGYLTNFPGLTAQALRKFPPASVPMTKGHLDQTRMNQRSTRAVTLIEPDSDDPLHGNDDFTPTAASTKTFECFCAIAEPTGQIYTDQTGRFISPSSTGNNYLMIMYDYDSNFIFAQPMKNRQGPTILDAYATLHARLCNAGLKPRLQRLDNECSTLLKDFMHDNDVDYQLVPPGIHRRNAAERAIRTFKNHFIAGLCSVDKNFPIHLWDRLLPQAEITLNLLRGSRINPKLSAWAQVHGAFDFNRTPLGPPGCRVVAHEKPAKRKTWAPHGLDGWYVGPAMESYRCHTVWIWETRATRIIDTLTWFPSKVKLPDSSSTDVILSCLQDILHALQHPAPKSPLAPRTDTQTQALHDLVTLLGTLPPAPAPPTPAPIATPPPPEPAAPLRVPPVPDGRMIDEIQEDQYELEHGHLPPIPIGFEGCVPSPRTTAPMPIPATAPPLRVASPDTAPTPTLIPNDDEPPTPVVPSTPPPAAALPTTVPSPTIPHINTTVNRPRHRPRRRNRKPARRSRRIQQNCHARSYHARAQSARTKLFTSNFTSHHAMHGTAVNPDTGGIAEYRELSTCSDGALWQASNADEIGRMFQGLGPTSYMPEGTNTLFFIDKKDIPKHKKPTYVRVVCADRPEKPNPKRVRWTAGGDKVEYTGNVTTQTADIQTAKCLFNSVVSTPDAKFMTLDLKDFYLCSDLPDYEYVRIPMHMIPPAIVELYKLENKISNGYVYAEVRKGMYGLPQAGKLANDRLRKFLEPHGYVPCPVTPGLWKHLHSDLMFTLVVDDFGVKYTNKQDVEDLIAVITKEYKCSQDWSGNRYIGLTLDWNYEKRYVDLSMPGYIARALQRFMHPTPGRPEHAPHAWTAPTYGSRQQYATHDTSPAVDSKDTIRIQEVLGTLLYYARAVDCTMITAIGSIATQQANATTATMQAITQLLNYCATHPNAVVRYYSSDMVLYIESDASYLSETKARSRAAGYHYLSNNPPQPNQPPAPTDPSPPMNGAISVPCKVMREVLSSASEAELAALFYNGKEGAPLRITLEELGHPQPPTPMVTDNSTASGIANESVKQKRSKAMDMRFYWIRDRVRQGQYLVYWRRGSTNRADYFTKHHHPKHHVAMRPAYLLEPNHDNYYSCLDDDGPPQAPSKASPASGEGVLKARARATHMPRGPARRSVRPARSAE
jgi:hypothetical protein